MLADPDKRSSRVRVWATMFRAAGFPVTVSRNAQGWPLAHAAFIVPIAFALYRVNVQPHRLAADEALLTTMVAATRQSFQALQAGGNCEIPCNLRWLYLRFPETWGRSFGQLPVVGSDLT